MEKWIMNLLIPMIMIMFGLYFYKHGPKTINPIFGYRTSMSMKNEETWKFAHHYCGKVWIICGLAMMVLTIAIKTANLLETYQSAFVFLQVMILIISIVPVEVALRKTFDKNGKRRDR